MKLTLLVQDLPGLLEVFLTAHVLTSMRLVPLNQCLLNWLYPVGTNLR